MPPLLLLLLLLYPYDSNTIVHYHEQSSGEPARQEPFESQQKSILIQPSEWLAKFETLLAAARCLLSG